MEPFLGKFLDKAIRWLRFHKVIKHIPQDSIVCDIGCGRNNTFLEGIKHLIKYGIGIDKNIGGVIKNDTNNIKRIEFYISNKIPIESKSIDVVIMMAILEHLTDPLGILDESYRILRSGGKLIITVPTPLAKPVLEFMAFKLKIIDESEIRDHKNYFWINDIKTMLQKSGFKEDKIKGHYFEFGFNSFIVAKK